MQAILNSRFKVQVLLTVVFVWKINADSSGLEFKCD